jgi:hypothetical protein
MTAIAPPDLDRIVELPWTGLGGGFDQDKKRHRRSTEQWCHYNADSLRPPS